MSETMLFAVADVKALAHHVLDSNIRYDHSGSLATDGLRYCVGCGAYDYEDGKGMQHEHDCITKVAQDVLTGLGE